MTLNDLGDSDELKAIDPTTVLKFSTQPPEEKHFYHCYNCGQYDTIPGPERDLRCKSCGAYYTHINKIE